MKFTKMHGLGNDYVYVNLFEEQVDDPAATAIAVSDRHFGIGSDGLILIGPSENADFEMIMYNADGSRGEMCGNGIRCVGKYVYDHGMTDKTEVSVETLGGIKILGLTVGDDGKVAQVRVDMGEPILMPPSIPMDLSQAGCTIDQPDKVDDGRCKGKDCEHYDTFTKHDCLACAGTERGVCAVGVPVDFADGDQAMTITRALGDNLTLTGVSMGNPHAVLYVDDVDSLDLAAIGPAFENHPLFPNRVNTEFIQILDRDHVKMRVWERGSGETMACGTGACAVTVAGVLNDVTDRHLLVDLLGGTLDITWDEESGHVFMTGPATTVFEGEW